MADEGRTVVTFKCPCSDAESPPPPPAPRVSYWVEAEAPGGFPALLAGRCARCGDRFCLLSPAGSGGLGKYQVFPWTRFGVGDYPLSPDLLAGTWESQDCSPQGRLDVEEATQDRLAG